MHEALAGFLLVYSVKEHRVVLDIFISAFAYQPFRRWIVVKAIGKAGGKSALSDGGSSDVYAWEEPERYYLCKWRRVLFYDAGGKYAGVGGL